MNSPERVILEPFLVAGISARTNNAAEMNAHTAQIPMLWTLFFAGAIANDIVNQTPNSPTYGVYHRYASNTNGDYTLTVGVGVASTALTAEDVGVETIAIAGGDYLIFHSASDAPEHIIQTWQTIWAYFAQHPEIKRAYHTDFEAYLGAGRASIYIGIQTKSSTII